MVKCDKGFVEIKGSKNEVTAETSILLRSLREHISKDEFEEVIESEDEIKAEVRKAKKRIAEMLKEILFDEEDK